MDSRNAWSTPSCLGQCGFITLLVTFMLEELLGLLKALAELSRIDFLAIGIFTIDRLVTQVAVSYALYIFSIVHYNRVANIIR